MAETQKPWSRIRPAFADGRFPSHLAWAIVLAVALAGTCRAQTAGTYRVDPDSSRVEIHVFRGGLFGSFADNHVIRLVRFSGTAEATQLGAWLVRVTGASGSLQVVDPGASGSTRQQVQEKMLGPTQMDVAHYPTIELRSRSLLTGDTDHSWRILADLTVHGVTRRVEFPLAWSESGDRLRVQGTKRLMLRDFNIEPIRLGLGTVKVRNDFELAYDITLLRQSLTTSGR